MQPLPPKAANRPDPVATGRSWPSGLGVNLLVTDMAAMVTFLHGALAVRIDYWDDDFALAQVNGSSFMLHHDRTYHAHSFQGSVTDISQRGAGIELRLYGCDPDAAVQKALAMDMVILAEPANKAHGVREAYIIGPDAYVWVPTLAALSDG